MPTTYEEYCRLNPDPPDETPGLADDIPALAVTSDDNDLCYHNAVGNEDYDTCDDCPINDKCIDRSK